MYLYWFDVEDTDGSANLVVVANDVEEARELAHQILVRDLDLTNGIVTEWYGRMKEKLDAKAPRVVMIPGGIYIGCDYDG